MNELVKLNTPELQEIEKSKAEKIKATFEPMAKMLSEFEKEYNELMSIPIEEMTLELTQKYKRCRLDIGKVRIETSKLKDKQKEYIKLEDKAIMGVHNILVWAVKEKEDKLKEREDYFEIQEQKRLEVLQSERAEMLSKYIEDAHERNLSSMDCDVWEAYFQAKKKEYEDRILAEKKAEEDRIERQKAEIERQKAIEKENARLKAEAEAAAKKQEAERLERERLAKIEADKLAKEEAKRKAAEEAKQKEYEAKIKVEREEKERIQKELELKAEAERLAIEETKKAEQLELNKNDKAKVQDLINDLNSLKEKYSFKSEKNKIMYNQVGQLIDKVVNHINK